jgi:hypothetical protein
LDKEFEGLFDKGNGDEGDNEVSSRSSVPNFMQHYGWIYQTELVANYERITIEEAFNLKTINYLNDLAYLKAKSEYEKELMKKAYGKKH